MQKAGLLPAASGEQIWAHSGICWEKSYEIQYWREERSRTAG